MITLKGTAASPGTAEGTVCVVNGAQDIPRFKDGDVLVAKVTEPSMVIMMNMAAAIVTDRGGLTTHAAIVSRELGVPCVVGTEKATTILKDGMKVRVDGKAGTVEVI
jgi:pyruvate,water dikinase